MGVRLLFVGALVAAAAAQLAAGAASSVTAPMLDVEPSALLFGGSVAALASIAALGALFVHRSRKGAKSGRLLPSQTLDLEAALAVGGKNQAGQERPTKEQQQQQEEPEPEYDVVIAGCGVAGGAAAVYLGRQGKRVLVVERDLSEPERIVGELLQPGGVEKLVQLGISDALEGFDAQAVPGYGVVRNGGSFPLYYPDRPQDGNPEQTKAGKKRGKPSKKGAEKNNKDEAKQAEPAAATTKFSGRGFHNGRFLMRMRQLARENPNVTVREGTVTKLVEDGGKVVGVVYREKVEAKDAEKGNSKKKGGAQEGKEQDEQAARKRPKRKETRTRLARGALTILSDGFFSTLRKSLSVPQIKITSHFLGLVIDNCEPPFPGMGNVVLADPTPILVYPISSTEYRVLVDYEGEMPKGSNGDLFRDLEQRVLPQMPEGCRESFLREVRARRIKIMPNKIMPARPVQVPGAVLLGDALNMRHPLTGGGMTVAFTDLANLGPRLAAVKDFRSDEGRDQLTKAVAEFYRTRGGGVMAVNMLADALYHVFSQKNNDLREACYDYLSRGPEYFGGPVALLSGLSRDQMLLVRHFFAVALHSVKLTLSSGFPTPGKFIKAFLTLRAAVGIIRPLALNENRSYALAALCAIARVVFVV